MFRVLLPIKQCKTLQLLGLYEKLNHRELSADQFCAVVSFLRNVGHVNPNMIVKTDNASLIVTSLDDDDIRYTYFDEETWGEKSERCNLQTVKRKELLQFAERYAGYKIVKE